MSHCRDPEHCSVCLGVPAVRYELAAGSVVADGVAVRAGDVGAMSQNTRASAARGARASRRNGRKL